MSWNPKFTRAGNPDFKPMFETRVAPEYNAATDYGTPEEAIKAVETAGGGRVVKFNARPNNHGCLPEVVYNSVGMWTYSEVQGKMKWQAHYIYDGVGAPFKEEQPN